MRLNGIRTGDIVQADVKGRIFYALVIGRAIGQQLEIAPLARGISYRTVRAREVVAHWSKRGAS